MLKSARPKNCKRFFLQTLILQTFANFATFANAAYWRSVTRRGARRRGRRRRNLAARTSAGRENPHQLEASAKRSIGIACCLRELQVDNRYRNVSLLKILEFCLMIWCEQIDEVDDADSPELVAKPEESDAHGGHLFS